MIEEEGVGTLGTMGAVDAFGRWCKGYGIDEANGRVVAALMGERHPSSVDQVARSAGVPREVAAEVLHMFERMGLATADSEGRYAWRDDAWNYRLQTAATRCGELKRLVHEVLPGTEGVMTERLHELVRFCDFMSGEAPAMASRYGASKTQGCTGSCG